MRNEREFQRILDEARNVPGLEKKADMGRQRKVPRWMECGESVLIERLHTSDTADDGSIDQMRQSYYETIDAIVQSVSERFEQENLSLVKSIEQILLRSRSSSCTIPCPSPQHPVSAHLALSDDLKHGYEQRREQII